MGILFRNEIHVVCCSFTNEKFLKSNSSSLFYEKFLALIRSTACYDSLKYWSPPIKKKSHFFRLRQNSISKTFCGKRSIALPCFFYSLLHWPAFLKLFQIPSRKVYHSDSFFPAEYEYVNHFFPARPDFPKFYVKGLKITLNSCF